MLHIVDAIYVCAELKVNGGLAAPCKESGWVAGHPLIFYRAPSMYDVFGYNRRAPCFVQVLCLAHPIFYWLRLA